MRNAHNTMAGHPPRSSGSATETHSIRRLMTEAGMSAGICLEWLIDRFERPETGQ
ncbi:MAG: hypothetical protein ACRBBS_18425 [Thalassovita sp.]